MTQSHASLGADGVGAWLRLTAAELSALRTTSELIGRAEERYNLSHEQAASGAEF
jgi:hypothetical protein